MNWELLGAVGEILGALATIAMLMYLSIQIRHARETTQSSTELEAAKLLAHSTERIALNRDLQRIWDKVAEDSTSISDEDLTHFLWMVAASMHTAEGVWEQYQRGFISNRVWKEWERNLCGILRKPSINSWWAKRIAPYSPEFYDYMDQALVSNSEWEMPPSSVSIELIRKASANDT